MEVPLLELLSHQLRGELQFARHRKSLGKLALIDEMIEGEDLQTLHVLHRLAMTALSNASVASKDMIFFSGTRAAHAYLKLSGDLTYFTDNLEVSMDDNGWIAEICLWTPWACTLLVGFPGTCYLRAAAAAADPGTRAGAASSVHRWS